MSLSLANEAFAMVCIPILLLSTIKRIWTVHITANVVNIHEVLVQYNNKGFVPAENVFLPNKEINKQLTDAENLNHSIHAASFWHSKAKHSTTSIYRYIVCIMSS